MKRAAVGRCRSQSAACCIGCNKPSEDACKQAILNIKHLKGTDNLTSDTGSIDGEIRRCRGGSTKEAVACAGAAKTLEELDRCAFNKPVRRVALGAIAVGASVVAGGHERDARTRRSPRSPRPTTLAARCSSGPSGQVYEPDGHGAWARHHAGGVGDDVVVAVSVGDAVIAGAGDAASAHAPPFRYAAGVWQIVPVSLRAHAVVGRGTRAVAAVGRAVFTLDGGSRALPGGARRRWSASARLRGGVAIQTEPRRVPPRRQPLDVRSRAPEAGDAPARRPVRSQRGHGCGRPARGRRRSRGRPGSTRPRRRRSMPRVRSIAAATNGAVIELEIVRDGRAEHDRMPGGVVTEPLAPVAGVVLDRSGRIVVALRDGRVAVRDNGRDDKWSATAVRDDLPAPRPGAPPATSR